jgi:hypothetical protein
MSIGYDRPLLPQFEGIAAKRIDSQYEPGQPSRAWQDADQPRPGVSSVLGFGARG